MRAVLVDAVLAFNWFVLGYFLALNSTYLVLTVVAALEFGHHLRRAGFSGQQDLFDNPLTPPVSVLVPAYNERAGIVQSVHAMLALRYPEFEIVVVDDGSTDDTFEVLREAFDLVQVPRVLPRTVPTIGKVLSTHQPRDGSPLLVVRKDNAGRRSDPLNVAINAAQYPLIVMVDADSLLDEAALLRVAQPFVDDPGRVVATGGVVRAANGSLVSRGRIVRTLLPRGWVARIQVVEYLRSFLLGRTGWSKLEGLLIISGAFGMFRRDLVVEVGGLDLETLAEDAELVARLHRHLRGQRRDYRVVFVSEPVCWTEVPSDLRTLARQRLRWSRGLAEVLAKHWRMIGNPRYGRIGLVTLPYYLLFELLGPVVEVLGVIAVPLSFVLGIINLPFAIAFALVAVGYGVLLSIAAVAVEEFSYHRYQRWRDLLTMALAAALENLGFRQLHAWWRLRGLVRYLRRAEHSWGAMPRTGFAGVGAGEDRPEA